MIRFVCNTFRDVEKYRWEAQISFYDIGDESEEGNNSDLAPPPHQIQPHTEGSTPVFCAGGLPTDCATRVTPKDFELFLSRKSNVSQLFLFEKSNNFFVS